MSAGQWGRKLDRNINSYTHTRAHTHPVRQTLRFVSAESTTLLSLVPRSLWRGTQLFWLSWSSSS